MEKVGRELLMKDCGSERCSVVYTASPLLLRCLDTQLRLSTGFSLRPPSSIRRTILFCTSNQLIHCSLLLHTTVSPSHESIIYHIHRLESKTREEEAQRIVISRFQREGKQSRQDRKKQETGGSLLQSCRTWVSIERETPSNGGQRIPRCRRFYDTTSYQCPTRV